MKPTDNSENLNKIAVLFVILLYQQNQEPKNSLIYEHTTNIFIAGKKHLKTNPLTLQCHEKSV